MEYVYMICPKCMSGLIEKKEAAERNIKQCVQCGNKLVPALYGKKKIDNTIYKMVMNGEIFAFEDPFPAFRKEVQKGNFDVDTLVHRLETGGEGSLLYEGDAYHTYLLMLALDRTVIVLNGCTVTPKFPFTFAVEPMVALCPACGSETAEKLITDRPDREDEIGYYCEKCNQWVMGGCLGEKE